MSRVCLLVADSVEKTDSNSLYWRERRSGRAPLWVFYVDLKAGIGISLAIFRRFWAVAPRAA
jgi:hypothetical protein